MTLFLDSKNSPRKNHNYNTEILTIKISCTNLTSFRKCIVLLPFGDT
jgi:hypothetical protein